MLLKQPGLGSIYTHTCTSKHIKYLHVLTSSWKWTHLKSWYITHAHAHTHPLAINCDTMQPHLLLWMSGYSYTLLTSWSCTLDPFFVLFLVLVQSVDVIPSAPRAHTHHYTQPWGVCVCVWCDVVCGEEEETYQDGILYPPLTVTAIVGL